MRYVMHMGGKGEDNKIKALFEVYNKNYYPGLAIQTEADSEEELISKARLYFWGVEDNVSFMFSETIPEDLREKLACIPYKKERRVEDKPVKDERRKSLDGKIKGILKKLKDAVILSDN
jgi:hypothetical protein